jgi:hypothetical protein
MYERYEEFLVDLANDHHGLVGTAEYRLQKDMTVLEVSNYRRRYRMDLRQQGGAVIPTPTSSSEFTTRVVNRVDDRVRLSRQADLQQIRTRVDNLVTDARILSHNNQDDRVADLEAKALLKLQKAFDQLEIDLAGCIEMRRLA